MQRRRFLILNYGAEPKEGFEPPTNCLQGSRSDRTELHRLKEVAAEALSTNPSEHSAHCNAATCVPPTGFEPVTPALRVPGSKPLSYEGISTCCCSICCCCSNSLRCLARARAARLASIFEWLRTVTHFMQ